MIPLLSHYNSHLEEIFLHSRFLVWEDFAKSAIAVKPYTQEFRKGEKRQLLKQWHS